MKNIPRDLYRAGLYIRSASSSNNSKCFKWKALYGFCLIIVLSSYHSASDTEALRVQLYKYGIRLPKINPIMSILDWRVSPTPTSLRQCSRALSMASRGGTSMTTLSSRLAHRVLLGWTLKFPIKFLLWFSVSKMSSVRQSVVGSLLVVCMSHKSNCNSE